MMPGQWALLALFGAVAGFLNGLFGSGAGVLAVAALRPFLEERKAHATSTLSVLLMSTVSFGLYLLGGSVDLREGARFLIGGLLGAIVGAALLNRLSAQWLRRLFGGIVAVSGVVMLLR